jgi:mono/diheme cytochrome c family protein
MADIVSYRWSIRYFEDAGSARRGQRVFQAKQCARCHPAKPSPDFRAASLIAALWKHPPAVVAKMKRDMILWPTFLPGEVDDLIAFYRTTAR